MRRPTASGPIGAGLVWQLGLSQLLCWGISYYLLGVFGPAIAAETGWSPVLVSAGFSAALVVMGLSSPVVGRLIDRHGGRSVMSLGSVALALGCAGIALAHDLAVYGLAWPCLGVAMRMTLYEAAFAALVALGGAGARQPISQITLLGGLASSVFWPIGSALVGALGWRGACLVYAAVALATLPLHLAIPRRGGIVPARDVVPAPGPGTPALVEAGPRARTRAERRLAGGLYAMVVTLAAFLNSGMSTHMIGLLEGLGIGAALAVWLATLRGIGQSLARLAELLFGRRLDPLALGVAAAGVLPLAFLAGLVAGATPLAGALFAFAYGAGNGLLTITRGTQPLVLFEPAAYGRVVGWLVAPSFFLSALAPVAYAAVFERFGDAAALGLSIAVALVVLAGAVLLRLRFPPAQTPRSP